MKEGSSVKIEIEFKNVDEAIVAMSKLSSVANLPLAAAPAPERKPRNDKGKTREPYGPRDKGQGVAAAPGATVAGDGAAGVTESRSEAPQKANAPAVAAASSTVPDKPQSTPDPKAVVQAEVTALTEAADGKQPTETDVATASEGLAGAKGLQSVIDLLARFGVKRGRDIPINRRADYIKRAGEVAQGAAI